MRLQRLFVFASLLAAAGLACAHPQGTAHVHQGFVAGFLHPFTGADHLAAMLALGMWSALAVRPVWLAPAAFIAVLALGALAGAQGVPVPAIEPMIAASLLVIGLLVATQRRLPVIAAASLAAAFAFFHGAAHGSELAGGAALLGMVLTTAALHAGGIAIARLLLVRSAWLPRLAGSAVAVLGATLLLRLA